MPGTIDLMVPGLLISLVVQFLQRIPSWIRNKYFLTVLGFAVWMVFFDEQDIYTTHVKQKSELNKLIDSRDYYLQQIQSTKEELDQLKSDPAVLEKYAREKYRMKRDNEDIFVMEK